jgi:hypothetical protein
LPHLDHFSIKLGYPDNDNQQINNRLPQYHPPENHTRIPHCIAPHRTATMSHKYDEPPAYQAGPQAPQAAYQQQPYGGDPNYPGYSSAPNMGYHQQQSQGGFYPPQHGGYPPHQQQQGGYYPPHQQQQGGYYPPQQGGYYPQQQNRSGGDGGCMNAVFGALACCCCLELLF